MLFNSIKLKFAAKFNEAKPEGAAALAPRVGSSFIKDITFRKVGLKGEIPIATVNWNSNNSNVFFGDNVFEIALSGLKFSSKEEYSVLAGNCITISDVQINFIVENNVTKKSLSYTVVKHNVQPVFKKIGVAALESFQGTEATLYDACQRFAANAPYDVASAEFFEALTETITEDNNDDDFEIPVQD